jgi:hypothetical protein
MAVVTARHRDDETRLPEYGDEVLAVCPSCGGCVRVLARGAARRAACGRCAWWREVTPATTWWGDPVDPYLRLPLWLRTEVGDEVLWAYNERHLAALESYVAASLRERTRETGRPMSMLDKLPSWLKAAKNRDAVLAGLGRLRARLESA